MRSMVRCAARTAASLALIAAVTASEAGAQGYTYQLQARTAVTGGAPAFNLPGTATSGLSGISPALNDRGNVAFKVLAGSEGVWYGGNGAGGIVYTGPSGLSLGDVSLNNGGQAVWAQSSGANPGIYRYDAATNTSGLYANGPGSAPSTAVFTAPQINDAGQVGYRYQTATSAPRQFVSYDPATNTYATHAAEGTGNNAFLFSPAFNNARQIAGKVQLAAGPASDPNEIRLWNPDGSSQLIAQDNGASLASPYDRFFNSVGVNDVGQVAFIASLTAAAGGGQGVFLSNGLTTFTIATSLTSAVATFESFAPAVNNAGLVVFRARDDAGKYALWAGGGTSSAPLQRIITEGEIVQTDQGLAVIGGLAGELPFVGGPSLNEAGQVAFAASLLSATNPGVRLGNAVFVASPRSAAQVIPEPGTGALLALAALPPLVGAMRRRRSARPLRSERG